MTNATTQTENVTNMSAQQIIDYISTAPKKTPVKLRGIHRLGRGRRVGRDEPGPRLRRTQVPRGLRRLG